MKNPVIPTTYRIMLGAIKILQEEGWVKGRLHKPTGYCAVGAIIESGRRLQVHGDETDQAILLLEDSLGEGYIPSWNDKWYRRKSQVIKAMTNALTTIPQV